MDFFSSKKVKLTNNMFECLLESKEVNKLVRNAKIGLSTLLGLSLVGLTAVFMVSGVSISFVTALLIAAVVDGTYYGKFFHPIINSKKSVDDTMEQFKLTIQAFIAKNGKILDGKSFKIEYIDTVGELSNLQFEAVSKTEDGVFTKNTVECKSKVGTQSDYYRVSDDKNGLVGFFEKETTYDEVRRKLSSGNGYATNTEPSYVFKWYGSDCRDELPEEILTQACKYDENNKNRPLFRGKKKIIRL